MEDLYENTDDYNPSREIKILIDFNDKIPDIMSNKKVQALIKELLIRSRKLKYSLVFITQCYFLGFFFILFDHENKQQERITKYYD